MANLDTLTTAELFSEISGLAREQGISTQEDWDNLCDEVVDSHFDMAELNDDQDIQGKQEALYQMWEEYKRESGPESMNAISEDPESPHE